MIKFGPVLLACISFGKDIIIFVTIFIEKLAFANRGSIGFSVYREVLCIISSRYLIIFSRS